MTQEESKFGQEM